MPTFPPARAASCRRKRPNKMDATRLHTMANQIARAFAAEGEDQAIAATAEHIRLYWDPRMKAAILADDRKALSPIAAAAVDRIAS